MTLKSNLSDLPHQFVSEDIKEINWPNLWYWIRETQSFDVREYNVKKRPPSFHRTLRWFSPNLKCPVFIVGAPRSGTTFLGRCLSELPELSYHFEPIVIKAASYFVYTKQWSEARIKRFYRLVYAWLMRLHFDADLRLADKTPRNSLIIPTLLSVFPDAKFIFILRDGRDAALSLSQKPWYQNATKGCGMKEPAGYVFGPEMRFWVEPHRAQEFEQTSDIHRCVWIWRQYVEKILEDSQHVPEQQFYQVKYEVLVKNPRREMSKILDYLAIEADQSKAKVLDFIEKHATDASVGLWQDKLMDEALAEIDHEAGQLLQELGY